MIILNILLSNISTNEVIVKLDDLIDSLPKLFKTNRYCCWSKSNKFENLAVLRKIKAEKRPADGKLCFVDEIRRKISAIDDYDYDKIFFIFGKTGMIIVLGQIIEYKRFVKIAYHASILGFEVIRVYLLSPFIDKDIKRKLLIIIKRKVEFGFYLKMYEDFESFMSKSFKNNKLYTSATQIKDEFMNVNTLNLDYFLILIYCLFCFNIILLLIFFYHKLVLSIKKFISRRYLVH